MASQIPTSPPTVPWDVYISFRGKDTRYTFTDHLFKALHRTGVKTCMDDTELHNESNQASESKQAMRIWNSKSYVVVFSENYASSKWCLDELVEIYSCCKTMNKLVIPVYHNIDPSVVRHQTKSFKSAFKKHESRSKFGFFERASDKDSAKLEKIKKWRQTLSEVAGFLGQTITAQRSEAGIVDEIVDKILLEVYPHILGVAEHLVGLNSHVENVTALMSNDTEVVTKIGIYGMGGVGKTTLAKAVYNQNYRRFEGSCFLENVREVSVTTRGLVCLQQKLIDDVLKCKNIIIDNVNHGIEVIKARFSSLKVLIVFDDLDDPRSVEFLDGIYASGSIILITTRNEDLLDSINVEARYKVNELGDADSRELFAVHALRDNNITLDTYPELSKEILKHAGGLPLALEVFGSHLLKESEEGWRLFSNKLKRISLDDVESKLMISFDALKLVDPMLQDIYLDFACFFIGWNIKEVVEIMKTCYTFLDHHIDILKKRCLLTINDKDELGMHDLLRDMGRNIARNNSLDKPEKYNRLWISKDICNVLKNHLGTEAIKGIISSNSNQHDELEGVSFNMETFRRMSKLRFLKLSKVKLIGSFEQAFGNLRWFWWDACPLECLPSGFYPRKLVILELPRSNLRTMWELNKIPKVFEKLKTLNMTDSKDLITTPDFSKLPCLENLNFGGCGSLEEVHVSVGSLARLLYFSLLDCVMLRSLPESICNLRALKSLNICGCSGLEALPIELGNIESLKELNAERLNLRELPDSIRRLSNLFELRLRNSYRLKTLPDTIFSLKALKILTIGYCTGLETLPTKLGNLDSLIELNADNLNVSELPDSVGHLSKLVELKLMFNRNLQSLPDTICNLRALEVLNVDNCNSMKAFPIGLGNIESLKEINAERLSISELPHSIGRLSKLVTLRLCHNQNLRTLPKAIGNLRELKVLDISGCISLEALPIELGNIESLKELNAEFLTVSKLPDSIGRLSKLVELRLSFNIKLKSIPDTICNLSALEVLHITNCCSLETLPKRLGSIESLKYFNAEGLGISKLPDSIGQLNKLVELRLSYNNKLESLPDTICNLRSLQVLNIDYNSSLEALPTELGNIESLMELNAMGLTISELPYSVRFLSKLVTLRL